jgi:hypothetical protein
MYRERVLPPSEAQRVLARALEMQRAAGGGRDLAEADLARIADELGVSEAILRQALAGDDASDTEIPEEPHWFVGAPLRLEFRRHVPAVVGPEDHERIVGRIRRAFRDRGTTEVLGKTIEWTSTWPRNRRPRLRVRIEPAGQGSVVRVEEDLRSVAGGIFGGILGGVGSNALLWAFLAPLAFGAPPFVTVLLLTAFALLYGGLRAAFGAYVRARRATLARRLDEVAGEVIAVGAGGVRVDTAPRARMGAEGEGTDEATTAADGDAGADEGKLGRAR